jgi:hypothetical protein
MEKVHLILESERLRDMLEYAFVEGINAQREVSETRLDRLGARPPWSGVGVFRSQPDDLLSFSIARSTLSMRQPNA